MKDKSSFTHAHSFCEVFKGHGCSSKTSPHCRIHPHIVHDSRCAHSTPTDRYGTYEMESPELTAQTIIDTEFPTSEIILGFVVSVRDPAAEDLSTWQPAPPSMGERRITQHSSSRPNH